ncbi:MAG: hypothetical protein M0R46_13700 [Candidatus Muirbacterium halophilum]|nr:hypothetical protein [Candidatus Muirbacterium halophilum]MCK9476977.1 hypothetical protein [Candidatus Muirbacterium halophilum]
MKDEKKIDTKLIESLLKNFAESSVTKLSLKQDIMEIKAKKSSKVLYKRNTVIQHEKTEYNNEMTKTNTTFIESDRVGRYFSVNPPDSPNRIKNGDFISKGNKIANIVSMNVVYDVIAPFDAVIIQCLGEDGKMIEYGQALFEVEANGGK